MSDSTSTIAWDEFASWVRRLYDRDNLDSEERGYKLEIAERMQDTRAQLLVGDAGWIDGLKLALGKPNNLTNWRFNDVIKKWCQANPDAAVQAFSALWDESATVRQRFDGFLEIVPKQAAPTPTRNLAILHMAMGPASHPPFQSTAVSRAYAVLGYPKFQPTEDISGPGAEYEYFLGFLDRVLQEMAARDLPLRDRLDAQSVIWIVIAWDPPTDWPMEDQQQLRRYQGNSKILSHGEESVSLSETKLDEQGSTVGPKQLRGNPNVWWVNQGESYSLAREGGYIWAPQMNEKGTSYLHWSNMTKVRSNDIILHYSQKNLRAVGIAQGEADDADQPEGYTEAQKNHTQGWLVPTTYYDLNMPISLADIPQSWRTAGVGSPFNVDGGVNQGYLYEAPAFLFQRLVSAFPTAWPDRILELIKSLPAPPESTTQSYIEPPFDQIAESLDDLGLRIGERTLRQYHLSLKTRGFVILAGPSGTGKTWLATAYANAIDAAHAVVSVAPNWTSNEDLLGFHNPITDHYHHSAFSTFISEASEAWQRSASHGDEAQPFHLILDEMNLARIEYYFASFLSAMETRMREGSATLHLGPNHELQLTPNLKVIGTVNIDETTHGFADKVYDRAQLIELAISRDDVISHLGDAPYAHDLLAIWDAIRPVTVFAFRVLDEFATYIEGAGGMGVHWEEAFDEQVLQKILPKIRGADPAAGTALEHLQAITAERFPLSHTRISKMLNEYRSYGIASYFS